MDQVATRFTLPVHALAFSPTGINLAAGGDDEGIKLVDMTSCKVLRQLKAQVGPEAGRRVCGWWAADGCMWGVGSE